MPNSLTEYDLYVKTAEISRAFFYNASKAFTLTGFMEGIKVFLSVYKIQPHL